MKEINRQRADMLFKLFITLAITMIILLQFHEYQHYQDLKDIGCDNISYQFVRVQADCPLELSDEVIRMGEFRDKQFIYLWSIP
jgi:hypothetical protein